MQNITQNSEKTTNYRAVTPVCFGAKPLDLIKGHLTETSTPVIDSDIYPEIPFSKSLSSPFFVPVSRGLENEPVNWNRRSDNYNPDKDIHLVAKVQNFEAGGYEVTIIPQDLKALARRMDLPRKTGVRVKGEQNQNDIISSISRSKRKIRHSIKSMGCDRMLTLTKREKDPLYYWSVEDWAKAWDKFNRMCKSMGGGLIYLVVLEKHKKGNYHMHAAIAGRINVNHIRKIWLACVGGKGQGNVDIKYKRDVTAHQRRAGLAKYVSKYISKQIDQTEFNKKRYWRSKHKLPEVIRYILNSDNVQEALAEMSGFLGLYDRVVIDDAYYFGGDDGSDSVGCWFNYDIHLLEPVPF